VSRRRFEYTRDTSNKFWEVWQEGTSHRVRFGRIGTDGQERGKVHPSERACRQAILRLVASKLAKGYREVGARKAREVCNVCGRVLSRSMEGPLCDDCGKRRQAALKAWQTRREETAAVAMPVKDPKRQEAGRKAWKTIRKKEAEKKPPKKWMSAV